MTPRGILIVNKPIGLTSTDVVRRVRKRFGTRRVGHAGTLDPDASGVLIVCVGEATKVVPYLVNETKVYETTILFGSETQTDDAAGEVILERPWDHISKEDVLVALSALQSETSQIPPRVSALKVDGRRMHARVREGEDVEPLLRARDVDCYEIELLEHALPRTICRLTVGKGYYVRSFARDLGRAVGSAAHVLALHRTRVGPYTADEGVSLASIDANARLIPIEEALTHLPRIQTTRVAAMRLRHGQRIRLGDGIEFQGDTAQEGIVLILEPDGTSLAIGMIEDMTLLKVLRVFAPVTDASISD